MTWGWFPASLLFFFQLRMVNLSCVSAPMWNVGFLLAHKANGVIIEKEDTPGSHNCGGGGGAGWCFVHLSAGCPGHLPSNLPVLLVAHSVGKCLVADALWGLERWPFLRLWPSYSAGDAGRSGRFVGAGVQAIHGDLPSSHRPPSHAHFGGRLHKAPLFDWRWVYVKVINSN